MRTKVINLYGGPGCGKSTTAALLYGAMKMAGMHVELVREVAKSGAIRGEQYAAEDQLGLLAAQFAAERELYGRVDYIITDAPLWLNPFYQRRLWDQGYLSPVVEALCEYTNLVAQDHNFLVNRTKKFDPRHRFQDETEARRIDAAIQEYLQNDGITFHRLLGEDEAAMACEVFALMVPRA